MRLVGIARPEEFRQATRSHVIAWRDDLVRRVLSGMTIRHRLATLCSQLVHGLASPSRPPKCGIDLPRHGH